jgi:hypothetical protein
MNFRTHLEVLLITKLVKVRVLDSLMGCGLGDSARNRRDKRETKLT